MAPTLGVLRRQRCEAGDQLEQEVARAQVAASLFPSLEGHPTAVGRYLLGRRLGAGGMGVVFAAHDPNLKRDLAIKLLHPRINSPGANALFLKEAQSLARLVHPSVVTVFDTGLHDGRVFIAMELVDGRSMEHWLEARPPWRHSVAVLAQAARGLEAAHARGMVHRDFKPANVLLGSDGRVRVADFGLAREIGDTGLEPNLAPALPNADTARALTRMGDVVGTPSYMAPEAYVGTVQDPRTDQFAFCVSLYEAVWRRRPFEGNTLGELRDSILTCRPPMPPTGDVPDALVSAISRGLSKQRRDRFATMGELAAVLESLSEGTRVADVLRENPSVPAAPRRSAYEEYLAMLPDGLDSAPEHQIPTRITQIILAQKPFRDPPAEMVPVIESLYKQATFSAARGRALLAAFYDEHFESLEEFGEFMGTVSQTVMKVYFGMSPVPSPSSPHYLPAIVSVYNKNVRGMTVCIRESRERAAVLAVDHPPNLVNDVARVAMAEVIRALLLTTGCTIAEVTIIRRDAECFQMRAVWR